MIISFGYYPQRSSQLSQVTKTKSWLSNVQPPCPSKCIPPPKSPLLHIHKTKTLWYESSQNTTGKNDFLKIKTISVFIIKLYRHFGFQWLFLAIHPYLSRRHLISSQCCWMLGLHKSTTLMGQCVGVQKDLFSLFLLH